MENLINRQEEQDLYEIRLEVFEGPLELLLHLIEQAEIDIYNIPISEITDQFLDHIQTMEFLNLQVATDFLLMAATLMQIKARMLLPRPVVENDEDLEEEDPRQELVERLLEYKKVKKFASDLQERETKWSMYYGRSGGHFADQETAATSSVDPLGGDISLWDLVQAFGVLLESLTPRLELEGMPQEQYSIQDKMGKILKDLEEIPKILFTSLFTDNSRKAIVTCFLALLELIRLRKVIVRQNQIFSEIEIYRWEE